MYCTFIAESKNQQALSFGSKAIWICFALQLCLLALLASPQMAWAVSPPTISPGTGLYFPGPTVTISATGGATIFFTLDNSIPTVSSQVYSTCFTVNASTTVNAIAVLSGVSSAVATASFTVDPLTQPLSNAGYAPFLWLRSDIGVTSSSGQISSWADLSGSGNNATQSTSANQPSLASNDYNGFNSVALSTNQYFNLPSDFADIPNSWFYFVTKPTSSSNGVLIDLGNGSASDNVTVSLSSSTPTFTVYTGSSPSSLSASGALTQGQYQVLETCRPFGTIYVNSNWVVGGILSAPNNVTRTVNHIGTDYSGTANFYNGGFLEVLGFNGVFGSPSGDPVNVYLQARYQLLSPVPSTPIISVGTATLAGPTQVAIATTPDCTCRFTTDGSTPGSGSPLYTGPMNIYYSQTLNAIAMKNGLSSSVATATYTLDSSQWPAPNSGDMTPLQVNVQAPSN